MITKAEKSVLKSKDHFIWLNNPRDDKEPYYRYKSTDQGAVNILPIKYSFGEIGLGKLVKNVAYNKKRNNTQRLFKRWIKDGQAEINLHNNPTQISHGVCQTKVVNIVIVDKRAIDKSPCFSDKESRNECDEIGDSEQVYLANGALINDKIVFHIVLLSIGSWANFAELQKPEMFTCLNVTYNFWPEYDWAFSNPQVEIVENRIALFQGFRAFTAVRSHF